jgi:YhcH/YjgK/YiaL family protein
MIIDQLKHADCYYGIGRRVEAGLRFLGGSDLAGLAKGRHDIDGDAIYAMVSEYHTKPVGQVPWEAHRRYLDIQCLVTGEEKIGFARLADLKATQPYDVAKDCVLLDGSGECMVLRPGVFAVFMPHDGHMPGLAVKKPAMVKKVVVKVRL